MMRRTLRVLAVTGVWAAISIVAPTASADHVTVDWTYCPPTSTATPTSTPAGTPTPRPQSCTPDVGSRITGMQTVQFKVDASADEPLNLKQVDLYIKTNQRGIPSANDGAKVWTWGPYPRPGADGARACPPGQSSAPCGFLFDWDSVTLTPYNGSYNLVAVVQTHGARPDGQDDETIPAKHQDMRVDNPPKTPAAPRVLAKTATKISVEWDKAPEPDVLSYQLLRAETKGGDKAPPYSDFKEVAKGTETTFRDDVKQGNTYWYAVVVTRRSGIPPNAGINSAPSPASKAKVEPEAPAQPSGGSPTTGRVVPRARIVSRLPSLTLPNVGSRIPPVPDAPFSAFLPYDVPEGGDLPEQAEPGAGDPRGPVLPVAVGAFLVSSALALGRMPY